jgi:hypothetical protein
MMHRTRGRRDDLDAGIADEDIDAGGRPYHAIGTGCGAQRERVNRSYCRTVLSDGDNTAREAGSDRAAIPCGR